MLYIILESNFARSSLRTLYSASFAIKSIESLKFLLHNLKLGKGMKCEDTLWAGLTDSHAKLPMGLTAENLAVKYNISREDSDTFALRSQHLWGKVSILEKTKQLLSYLINYSGNVFMNCFDGYHVYGCVVLFYISTLCSNDLGK